MFNISFCLKRKERKKEIICNNIIKQYNKWLALLVLQKKPMKEHDPNWPKISHHSYRILGLWILKALFNPMGHEPDIEKSPYEFIS